MFPDILWGTRRNWNGYILLLLPTSLWPEVGAVTSGPEFNCHIPRAQTSLQLPSAGLCDRNALMLRMRVDFLTGN
jgi:hypothetical protein